MRMTSTTALPTEFAPPSARKPSAPAEFSYAAAAASLERSAGQSLKTFGAKEPGAEIAAARPGTSTPDPTRTTSPSPVRDAAQASSPAGAAQRGGAQTPGMSSEGAPSVSPPKGPAAAPDAGAQMNGSAMIVAAVPTGTAPPPRAHSGVGAIKTDAAHLQHKSAPHRAAAPAAVKSPEDFAQVLARRLHEGATEFQLRLDPPELGRIEARFVAGDDGAATLSISFDNQSAFDLFARDEAALRLALASAGFNFPEGGLSFSLQERPAFAETDATALPAGQDAGVVYAAALASVGVIDVQA